MPFTFAAPIGSIVSALIAGKMKVPPIYIVIFASMLQVVEFVLLTTLPASSKLLANQYDYKIIAGFGCGINISLLVLMTPFSVKTQDNDKFCLSSNISWRDARALIASSAVAMSSISQFRVMGDAVSLAVATTVLNSHVRPALAYFLSHEQVECLLRSAGTVSSFAPEAQEMIKTTFAEAYNMQMKILARFAAAQIPSSILMWQKKQIVV